MKWYLIWFLTVALPGQDVNTTEESFPMRDEQQCLEAMPIKQKGLESLLGTTRWVSGPLVAPTGGRGIIRGVTVGCVQR